jgi:ferredoxin-NAD(P)+ reductase (naphthalene dioxygenase ferredoxin-specific)
MATPPKQYKLKILSVKDLTKDVKEITFEMPKGVDFKPGQFATVKVEDGKTPPLMRSYSVMRSQDGKNLQWAIKLVENGRGSGWLFTKKEGEEMQVLFPLGFFTLPENPHDEVVFVGTGTGLVPLLCMLEALPAGYDKKVKLIFGVRYKEDMFYAERIEALKKKLPNFEAILTVSRADEKCEFCKGRVTEHLENPSMTAHYFMCGNQTMINDVNTFLLGKGVAKEQIHFESFG